MTPVERPEGQTEEFLTLEEAATTEQTVLDRNARANAPRELRTDPLPVGGNVGGYNSFWLDRGTTVVPTRRTSIIIDPPNGQLPALTPETARRLSSPQAQRIVDIQVAVLDPDSHEQLDLNDRCIWYRGIPTFSTAYNNNYHFFQTPDALVILQEHIHDVRYIFLDGRPHLPSSIRQFAGDSRGQWEGDTLVVETTHVREPFIRRWNLPQHSLGRGDLGDQVVLVERFTRTGPDTLNYEFTVNDPGTWTAPWSVEVPMMMRDETMYEYACHEGNHDIKHIQEVYRNIELQEAKAGQ